MATRERETKRAVVSDDSARREMRRDDSARERDERKQW